MNPWTSAVRHIDNLVPQSWKQNPPLTWAAHTAMTVLGLVPLPVGPFAIWYFVETTHSWPWILSSGAALIWYWVREYRQNGLKPKDVAKIIGTKVVRRTFIQRYDPWFDVLVPTFAYGLQLGLLGWLW